MTAESRGTQSPGRDIRTRMHSSNSDSVLECQQQFKLRGITVTPKYSLPDGAFQHSAIRTDAWTDAADIARQFDLRWSALWADQREDEIIIMAVLAGKNTHLLLSTVVSITNPALPSQTRIYPGANRPERHVQDMFGVHFTGNPDSRRWTRHQAWGKDEYPLRRDFPLQGHPAENTPTDHSYAFIKMAGEDIYEVPVGPVHAGIIEPGHFRFHTIGEDMLRLEEHLGYVHKGIEKIAQGRDMDALIRLAGRVSGDSTVTHSWAACQALEHALEIEVPPRALAIRAILCERERIANHCGDIGAICNDVGFSFALVQFSTLRERIQRLNNELFGHRLLMDCLAPGGVKHDISDAGIDMILAEQDMLYTEVAELMPMILEYPSLQDRLRTTGILPQEKAKALGALGYVGRASNQDYDLRRDAPYPPYTDLEIDSPVYPQGDVAKRTRVRGDEILISTQLIKTLLKAIPDGQICTEDITTGRQIPACEGIGLVEGWRGETLAYVRLNSGGRVERYFPRDPSWLNWPALEQTIHGNIIPDFPVCNKSVNGSYSGHDL